MPRRRHAEAEDAAPPAQDAAGLRRAHRLPLQGCASCSTSALTHISALAGPRNRAGSYQRLEFLGDHVLGLVISDMLFRAFPEGGRGRTVAPARRPRAQGGLRRRGARDRSRRGDPARRVGDQRRRPQPHRDPRRRLRGADRRGVLDGGYEAASELDRAALGASACGRRRGRCAIPRPSCRNGRRRAACRRRPTARSSAPARTTIRNSASTVELPNRDAGRRARPLQARGRAGGGGGDADARRREGGTSRWLKHRQSRAAASSR